MASACWARREEAEPQLAEATLHLGADGIKRVNPIGVHIFSLFLFFFFLFSEWRQSMSPRSIASAWQRR